MSEAHYLQLAAEKGEHTNMMFRGMVRVCMWFNMPMWWCVCGWVWFYVDVWRFVIGSLIAVATTIVF